MSAPVDPLADYSTFICDGNPPRTLIPIYGDADDDEYEGKLLAFDIYLIDAELDPIKVKIDCDGVLEIDTDAYSYISFEPDDLDFLAKIARKAKTILNSPTGNQT